ncbi:Gfo/Idh/MocA family oxidoreductase [Roseomonas aeriglobus]|nr:Gfo/Idh/MocA family oxidoreductase [Roseomonas aeriglobus]MBN2974458.1 Gfo/Idh/MocA family oxidoreductase [Roseomonas aeriglobus]
MTRHFVVASLGSIGQRHLRNLRILRPDARITALRRPESAPVTCDGCDGEVTSVEAALALRPDGVILAGPAPTHVRLARAFVEQGIPVFIEKPLSHDIIGLDELAAVAARGAIPVMVGYNLRFNPSLNALRQDLLGGAIGKVLAVRAEVGQYLPDWRSNADYRQGVSARRALGGGPILELSHEIDYLYWLFGMPAWVTCRGGRYSDLEMDVEDCVDICLEYAEPRRLVSVHLDFLQRPVARTCKFIGSGGTIVWEALRDRHIVEAMDGGRRVVESPLPDRNRMYLDELTDFLGAIEDGWPVSIPLSDGIDVMRIISAAARSLTIGRSISLLEVEPYA